MRIAMVFLTFIACFNMNNYKMKIIGFEREIYNLYINSFNDFLIVNESGEIRFDKKELKQYLLSKGYRVNVINKDYEICIDLEKDIKNKYCFYMVKNDEK